MLVKNQAGEQGVTGGHIRYHLMNSVLKKQCIVVSIGTTPLPAVTVSGTVIWCMINTTITWGATWGVFSRVQDCVAGPPPQSKKF